MKNIRIFIVCSSTVLMGWLAASYTSELESIEAGVASKSPSTTTAVVNPAQPREQDLDVPPASIASIK